MKNKVFKASTLCRDGSDVDRGRSDVQEGDVLGRSNVDRGLKQCMDGRCRGAEAMYRREGIELKQYM